MRVPVGTGLFLVLGYLLLAALVSWLLGRGISYLIERLARHARWSAAQDVARVSTYPLILLLFLLFAHIGQKLLAQSPGYQDLKVFTYIDGINFVLMVCFFTWWADRLWRTFVNWHFRRLGGPYEEHLLPIFLYSGRILLYFVATVIVLGYFHLNLSGLLATAGIASLAVAFATQETLSNMVAGFILLLDRPFTVGDRIEIVGTGLIGDVLEIGARSTKILTLNQTVAILSNRDLVSSRIINHSRPNVVARLEIPLVLPYQVKVEEVKAALLEELHKHPKVLSSPPPAVYLTDLAENQLRFLVVCHVANLRELLKVKDELNVAFKERLESLGALPGAS
ncbi:mechanosensitive ion channel family protein [Ammonifex degensii]|uniref:mechanosensitive ion channel family protein n=1 Tax=Ammonifex degensii TaxID=42838 RepID=UPI00145C4174|nr:mechanosensitive ion channel family protein [Ammonifex degensii]